MMGTPLRIVMAQIDFLVGDIPGNADLVLETTQRAIEEHQADVVVFPELALTGYPPEDLLLRPSLVPRVNAALERIREAALPVIMVIGAPHYEHGLLYNAALVIENGQTRAVYRKQALPNYLVFDEMRYFRAGQEPLVLDIKGVQVAVTICEDLWQEGPIEQAAQAGASMVLNLNASPYTFEKLQQRKSLLERKSRDNNLAIVYVNLVGGQDELVFDGGSMVYDHSGRCMVEAPQFEERLVPVDFQCDVHSQPVSQGEVEPLSPEESIYRALVLGVRDYVNKNGFQSVVMGLSGGIDSAVTLAVATDALGPERITAAMMPFRYTASMSLEDAEAEARALNVRYEVYPIEELYDGFMDLLAKPFEGYSADTTEENLQARIRGVILMSLSNKWRALVLTTGNKSEMAVGYSTLYGDMAGGFDVLKDVPKTWVYRLARWRNEQSPVIPQRVIDRPPSAELAPDQQDQDSLPDYDVLDQILNLYIERDYSADAIIAEGFEEADVNRAVRLVDLNEYKRRQAPIGVRITERGFGKDRRYPITNAWRPGE